MTDDSVLELFTHLQIVRIVFAVLMHSMSYIAGIQHSNAYRGSGGHVHCRVDLICLLSFIFDRNNKKYFTFFLILLQGSDHLDAWQLEFVSSLGTTKERH